MMQAVGQFVMKLDAKYMFSSSKKIFYESELFLL